MFDTSTLPGNVPVAEIGFIIANCFSHTTAGFHQLVDIGKKTYGDIKWRNAQEVVGN